MTTLSVLHITYVSQTIVLVCIHLFSDCVATAIVQNCLPGFFYDDTIQKCESCYSVCVHAILQRTEFCAQCGKVEAPPKPSPVLLTETTPVLIALVVAVIILFALVSTLILAFRNIHLLQKLGQNFQTRLSQQDVREISNGNTDGNKENENLISPIQEVNETPESDQATPLENYELIGETEMIAVHETSL